MTDKVSSRPATTVGLRVDVDTFRGTRIGVPSLCETLSDHGIYATFFFSVGPDNMGRHLWRLIRPGFFLKMLRTRASHLYGWDILLKGTVLPGPLIGERLTPIIRAVAEAGHETGFHAWDHFEWQNAIDKMRRGDMLEWMTKGVTTLTDIIGQPPSCSAAPGWKCNDLALSVKQTFPFCYNSDCRGTHIFTPVVNGMVVSQPQIPVTLPTYDEAIGRNGVNADNFNAFLISLVAPEKLNVLTIHAESEGIACLGMFRDFLKTATRQNIRFVTLGSLLKQARNIGRDTITPGFNHGRDGWMAYQSQGREIAAHAGCRP